MVNLSRPRVVMNGSTLDFFCTPFGTHRSPLDSTRSGAEFQTRHCMQLLETGARPLAKSFAPPASKCPSASVCDGEESPGVPLVFRSTSLGLAAGRSGQTQQG